MDFRKQSWGAPDQWFFLRKDVHIHIATSEVLKFFHHLLFISVFKIFYPFFMFLQRHQRIFALGYLKISSNQEETPITAITLLQPQYSQQTLKKQTFKSEIKQYLSNLFLRSGLIDTRWLLVWIPLTLNHSLNFGFSVPGAWRYLSMP